MRILSHSEATTRKFAKDLVKKSRGEQILALVGDLGSGKTTFVKGLAEGLKVKQTIHSPTFVLMRIFEVPKFLTNSTKTDKILIPERSRRVKITKLIHIDTYRLQDDAELFEIGALDYLGQPGTLTVIEWADRVKPLLKKFGKKVIWINFAYGKNEGERVIGAKC